MHNSDVNPPPEFSVELVSSKATRVSETYTVYYHADKYDVRVLYDSDDESQVVGIFNDKGTRLETSHKMWTVMDVVLYCEYMPDPTRGSNGSTYYLLGVPLRVYDGLPPA